MQKCDFIDECAKEYYEIVNKDKILNIRVLNNLLTTSNESKQMFIRSYLYQVFLYAYQIYSHVIDKVEVNYSFMDFVQDGNLLLIDMVSKEKYTSDIQTFSLYYWYYLFLFGLANFAGQKR